MFNSPGAYSPAKAKHDLQVLAQLREQLGSCPSLPEPDAATLASELLGLARSWLDQLLRDADDAGATELRAAAAAAAALAADAATEATLAADLLGRSLEDLNATLDRMASPVAAPASTDTPADASGSGSATVMPLAEAIATLEGFIAAPHAPAAPTPDPACQTALSASPGDPLDGVATFPPEQDRALPDSHSDDPDRVAAPTFPASFEEALVPAVSQAAADVALPTFPADRSDAVVPTEDASPMLPVLLPMQETTTDDAPTSGIRFAETMTFPPELDDRMSVGRLDAAPAFTPALGSPGREPEASALPSEAPATLDALAELSRQLELMCPRWGIGTSAEEPPIDATQQDAPEPVTFSIPEAVAVATAECDPASRVIQEPAGSSDDGLLGALGTETYTSAAESALVTSADADAPATEPLVPESAVRLTLPDAAAELPQPEPLQPIAEFETYDQSTLSSPDPTPKSDAEPPTPEAADAPLSPDVQPPAHEAADAPSVLEAADPTPPPPVPAAPEPAADPAAVMELTPEQMAALMAGGSATEVPAFSGELTPEQMAALMADGAADAGGSWGSVPLQLSAEKLQALQFVVAGVSDHFKNFRTTVWELAVQASREDGTELLKAAAKRLGELTSVCDFAALSTIRELMVRTAESICAVPEAGVPEVLIRVMSLGNLVDQALRGLEVGMEVRWPLDILSERLHLLLRGEVLHPDLQGWHQGDAERLLELDRVSESFNNPPSPETSVAPRGSQFLPNAAWSHVFDRRSAVGDRRTGGDAPADRRGYGQATLRVPVSSVERMAAMVADLVVTKNQLLGVLDRLSAGRLAPADVELARTGSGDLARLTSGLDVTLTMMQVRLQSLGHLFDRFPRVIRDVASVADKNVELRTDAGSVQVDKGMFDALSDPIGQLLRALVTRSIETPAERDAAGKPPAATIELLAESKGTRVLITIAHDGRPTPRAEIVERAVELEMLTPELAAALTDEQIQALEFDEHYCDPDLSQVAAKIRAINGNIAVRLDQGRTCYVIAAPLGVAVLDAVMVGVGGERYGIPLANVEEISQVGDADVSTVRGRAVLRRRDGVVALIDMRTALGMPPAAQPDRAGKRPGTAVVIKTQHHRAALLVTRVLAKEELVVRSLSAEFASAKIFSGATISGDGKVNLIVDPDRLAEHAHLESLRDA